MSCNYVAPQSTLPSGTWTNSCQSSAATYNDGILTATCNAPNGGTVQSTLQYAHVCASGATVSNINGYLSCDTYGAWWSTPQGAQYSFATNNAWLAADNSSCIIQDFGQSGNDSELKYACKYNDGSYRISSGLQIISKCPNNKLSNQNGVLACQ